MGYIGGVGCGVSQGLAANFADLTATNRDMNTLFGLKCVGNYSNPSQSWQEWLNVVCSKKLICF